MKPNKKKNSAKAEEVLLAADILFCERGFDAVSMRDVALKAEVNKASVFYYFGSKEQLFEQVLERYYSAHREALAPALASREGSLRERMHRFLDAYLDFMTTHRRYAHLIQIQSASGSDTHPQIQIRKNLYPLFEWITEAIGEATPAAGPLSARHFFVTLSALVINYFTYSPLLEGIWGADPLSEASLAERRAHVHWMVDAILDRLAGEGHSAG